MAINTKIDPIGTTEILMLTEGMSPAERSKALAEFARSNLAAAQEINRGVLGRIPEHTTFVDNRPGASEDAVRPDGVIVYEFDLIDEVFEWIGDMLVQHAPVRKGDYAASFIFTADGEVYEPGALLPDADEYVFTNIQPYARKIERGLSAQAPDGVFEVVAAMASRRFGNVAKIRFSYRAPIFGAINTWASTTVMKSPYRRGVKRDEWLRRQPAIVITR